MRGAEPVMLSKIRHRFRFDCLVRPLCLSALVVNVVVCSRISAEETRQIVARVGDDAVFSDEVERELRSAYGRDFALNELSAEVRQRAAEQVVNRRLVLVYLQDSKQAASQQDLDFSIEQLRKELKLQGMTFQEYLKRGKWSEDDFRRHLSWRHSWAQFLDRTLTEASLRKFYDNHRADFDGRELRVAHLLLKTDVNDRQQLRQAEVEAGRIRAEIEAGKLTFDEAVKKFSQAPTSSTGGELGFIQRREPMPEAFSKAAFALKKDEVSLPVVSPFGVHLIRCMEVRPGNRTWQESEAEVRKSAAKYLFEWASDKQRAKTKVEWVDSENAVAVDATK
jgi:parvulin-like peptidyl-prolyl isomerase